MRFGFTWKPPDIQANNVFLQKQKDSENNRQLVTLNILHTSSNISFLGEMSLNQMIIHNFVLTQGLIYYKLYLYSTKIPCKQY